MKNTEEQKDRNRCIESLCVFIEKEDTTKGISWEECNRCGRKRNLSYRV